ncbi:hypothetical protein LCGC14_2144420, partial [marine sediment metagenome]
SGALTAGDTAVVLEDSQMVEVGSIISVGSQGGEQLRVTANAYPTSNTLTVTRGWGITSAATISNGAILIPWSPAAQTLETTLPIAGTIGSLTIDGQSFTVKSWSLKLKKNANYHNDHYGTTSADGYATPNKREVSLEVTFRLERDLIPKVIGIGKNEAVHSVTLVAGNATGNTHTFVMARCKGMAMPPIEYPERDEVDVTVTWTPTHTAENTELTYNIT